MSIPQTDSLAWPNNVNTTTQAGPNGTQQNLAYFDADWGVQYGPNDPRYTVINQIPINLFRPHIYSDFDEISLDNRWQFSAYSSGALVMGNSCAAINSGLTNGGGGKLTLYRQVPFIPGQRVYFYLTTIPNGNLALEFGISGATNFAKFSRIEDNTAQNYFAKVQSSAGSANIDTGTTGNSIRRLFCLSIESGGVRFYCGTDAGVLVDSGFYPAIPSGTGNIFIDFKSRYAAARCVSVDAVYAILIR